MNDWEGREMRDKVVQKANCKVNKIYSSSGGKTWNKNFLSSVTLSFWFPFGVLFVASRKYYLLDTMG